MNRNIKPALYTVDWPRYGPSVGWLYLAPHYRVELIRYPNAWHRWWTGFLLGWTYQRGDIKGK